jgi:hypothetical protein
MIDGVALFWDRLGKKSTKERSIRWERSGARNASRKHRKLIRNSYPFGLVMRAYGT